VRPVFGVKASSEAVRPAASSCVFVNVVHWNPKLSAYDEGGVKRGIPPTAGNR
jgi:hypothetical protein